jgi:hypothetical protein
MSQHLCAFTARAPSVWTAAIRGHFPCPECGESLSPKPAVSSRIIVLSIATGLIVNLLIHPGTWRGTVVALLVADSTFLVLRLAYAGHAEHGHYPACSALYRRVKIAAAVVVVVGLIQLFAWLFRANGT